MELKTTDLRIGNFLTNGTVVGLTDSIITVYDGYRNWTSDKVEMSPIAIDADWVIRLGFSQSEVNSDAYTIDEHNCVVFMKSEIRNIPHPYVSIGAQRIFKVDFVHQLQNVIHYLSQVQ